MTESESDNIQRKTKAEYREMINKMGKKEFTLLKMQEYGFWPKDLPTPYERQKNETEEQYNQRKKLLKKYKGIVDQIADLYKEKSDISRKLRDLRKQYDATWDIEKIRKDVAKQILKESVQRRAELKKQRELEKQRRSEAWQRKKAENIIFVGKGYSSFLNHFECNEESLNGFDLPIIKTDRELAMLLELDYKELRFICYHRDVLDTDHYFRYTIPKRSGGKRLIAAPKTILKSAQRIILDKLLEKIPISQYAHGFLKKRSVISGANSHPVQPELLINIDLEDFFPTITFERVRGMFHSFGYSGHISTLLAMICTYCERIPIEVKGTMKYAAVSKRILPQGSPASPMITNIICYKLDRRLAGLADSFELNYTRYADDMSFSLEVEKPSEVNIGRFLGIVSMIIKEEGFKINPKKTRFLRKNNRQEITGIIINNNMIGLHRKWIRQFRAALHNAEQLQQNGGIPNEIRYEIAGMASWVRSVNPERYQNYLTQANRLLNPDIQKK